MTEQTALLLFGCINLVLGVLLGYHIRKLHEPAKPEPYDERESNP